MHEAENVYLCFDKANFSGSGKKKELFNFYLIDDKENFLLYKKAAPIAKLPAFLKQQFTEMPQIVIYWDRFKILPFNGAPYLYELRREIVDALMLDEDEALNITQGLWHCDLDFTVKRWNYTPIPNDHIQSSLRYECHTLLKMHQAYMNEYI